MKKSKTAAAARGLSVLVGLALMAACAYQTQTATIKPEVQVYQSAVGKGRAVYVAVSDERDSADLGHRGTAVYSKMAAISNTQDLAEVFRQAVFDALKAQGFEPTSSDKSVSRQLKVEIRSLDYSTSTGFFTGGVDTKAAIKVIVTTSDGSLDHLYRSANEERVMFSPTADHNSELINKVVNDVLTQLFQDQSMIGKLAKD
jgi:uncharacterized lipoprotein YajG